MPLPPDAFVDELWSIARQVPMLDHPWFRGILEHRWSREQIILGEVQDYLRVRTNPIFFGYIAINAVAQKTIRPHGCGLRKFPGGSVRPANARRYQDVANSSTRRELMNGPE